MRLSFLRIALFIVLTVFFLMISCMALTKIKPITVDGLAFRNNSSNLIENALLVVVKTNRFISCGPILPDKECSTTFPQKKYRGNHIIVKWRQNGKSWSSKELKIQIPNNVLPGKSSKVIIIIDDQGYVQATFVQ